MTTKAPRPVHGPCPECETGKLAFYPDEPQTAFEAGIAGGLVCNECGHEINEGGRVDALKLYHYFALTWATPR